MIINYLKLIYKKLREKKISWLILGIISKLTCGIIELRADIVVEKKRRDLSKKISTKFNYTVQQGPFKNMILSKKQYWGIGDNGKKILGLYEKEIQDLIVEIQEKKQYKTLIDIGGADGFYAVGSVVNNLFQECLVFETSNKGRESISNNAKLNNVEDMISIQGIATESAVLDLPRDINQSLILCDIEGGEFELFSSKLLEKLYPSNIIIEIHKRSKKDEIDLEKRISKLFTIKKIIQNPKSLHIFDELKNFNDNNRSLLLSEGRSYVQEWWHVTPK
tara:strand:- start:159 stop:989 length:831 start_codon:yes stop_codon:yes gene_type:complete